MNADQQKYITDEIEPVLKKHNAKVVKVIEEFYNFITVSFKDNEIEIHASWLEKDILDFMFKEWDNFISIANDLNNKNPFYSDIYGRIKQKYPRTKRGKTSMVHAIVCDTLRKRGIRIWS